MEVPGQVPSVVACNACQEAIDLTGQRPFSTILCPYCQASMIVPVEFGNYLLLGMLGSGGMGTVYKALDVPLERMVGLKLLKPDLAADPGFIERFTREARAAATVNHVNVATVYSSGQEGPFYYIAMELLESGSLDDRMTQLTKIPEEQLLQIGIQIASGLQAAYESGLLHRDVKPGNVLFDKEGTPKIVDFGLARARGRQEGEGKGGPVWGTPYYIAPEKLLGHSDDLRSDIYSFGATLFHALAGRPPFEAATATDVAVKHTTQPVTSLKIFVPGVQERTAQTIGRMLAKNPAERYFSYEEVINDLQEALTKLRANAAIKGLETESGEKIPMATVIGTIAILFVGLVAVLLLVFNWNRLFVEEPAPPAPPVTGIASNQIASTNSPATNAVAQVVTPPATNPPPPSPAVAVSFQPQQPWGPGWFRAARAAVAGDTAQAVAEYGSLRSLLTKQPEHLAWVDFFQGVVLLPAGRTEEAETLFAGLTNGTDAAALTLPEEVTTANLIPPLAAAMLQPEAMPQIVAQEGRLPPALYAVVQLAAACHYMVNENLGEAVQHFEKYSKARFDPEQQWCFALDKFASHLREQCVEAATIAREADEQTQRKQSARAIEILQAGAERLTVPALREQFKARASRLQEQATANQQELAAKRAAQEKARREQLEKQQRAKQLAAEKKKLEQEKQLAAATLKAVDEPVAQFKFAVARQTLEQAQNQITTPVVREPLADRLAQVNLLAEFQQQLIADIARSPYTGEDLVTRDGAALIGRLAEATSDAAVFVLPHGQIRTPWTDLSRASLQQLGLHYTKMATTSQPAADAARRWLQLAVFCRETGLADAAQEYGQQAEKLDPALKTETRRLLK